MLTQLRADRAVLILEVDRARTWRHSPALDKIRNSLEAKLVALDKSIKTASEQAVA
jgi:hypothetical protein